jgi:adenine-specific DNA-methyltransferase
MELNAEDGGSRKWILVQLPEETEENSEAFKAGYRTIADIAKERIRRAGKKILEETASRHSREGGNPFLNPRVKPEDGESGKHENYKLDTGFKVLKLSKSNYRQWNILTGEDNKEKLIKQMKLLLEKPLVDGHKEKSVVYEILLKEGFDLNSEVKRHVIPATELESKGLPLWIIIDSDSEQKKKMMITFVDEITTEQVEALNLSENDIFVCLDSALNDTTKINIARNLHVKVI